MEVKGTPPIMPRDLPTASEPEEKKEIIRDSFSFSEKDLSESGKLTLIIQPKEKRSLDEVKNQCEKCGLGSHKEDLEIIDGFTYEIDPSDLTEFLTMLPQDVEVSVDRKVQFFSMEQVPKQK